MSFFFFFFLGEKFEVVVVVLGDSLGLLSSARASRGIDRDHATETGVFIDTSKHEQHKHVAWRGAPLLNISQPRHTPTACDHITYGMTGLKDLVSPTFAPITL